MKSIFRPIIGVSMTLLIATWLFANISNAWSDKVVVSAVVWPINSSPSVISTSPSDEPFILARAEMQEFRVTLFDREKDRINFTVTPSRGYVFPSSGRISSTEYSSGGMTLVKFRYLAPFSQIGDESITITLSDGPNIVTKTIPLYVY